jgi:outer membrane murein-binding lipoprotein Lpp
MLRRTFLLVAVAVLAAAVWVTPALAGSTSPSLAKRVATLEAQVALLTQSVNDLSTQLAAVQRANAGLRSDVDGVLANPVLDLGPYVSLDLGTMNGVVGPNIVFTGANLHVVSGSGSTDDGGSLTGLGNLIIGYDEAWQDHVLRNGSHNLVLGWTNNFSGYGGFVAGAGNGISEGFASVSGGAANVASGMFASVSGGSENTASGTCASVSGGMANDATGDEASVGGGSGNTASGPSASISGGGANYASGEAASVSGGFGNTASGSWASVSGGDSNEARGMWASVGGGYWILLDMDRGWAAGVPGFPAVPALNQAWFLAPLLPSAP